MLVRPSKCLKEIVYTKHNGVKNPKWLEANQLAIYKRGRRFELDTTKNKSSYRSGAPNESFFLNALKTLFRLSRVFSDF